MIPSTARKRNLIQAAVVINLSISVVIRLENLELTALVNHAHLFLLVKCIFLLFTQRWLVIRQTSKVDVEKNFKNHFLA